MNRRLWLIKHAVPVLNPREPASRWPLSSRGCQQADRLARWLQGRDVFPQILSSPEPKAHQTAQILGSILGAPLQVLPGLHEHRREEVGWLPGQEFPRRVRQFFETPNQLVFGEETAQEAGQRFQMEVKRGLELHPAANPLAVVAHGTVITLFVQQYSPIPTDPFPFWRQLGLPSAVCLSWPHGEILELLPALGGEDPLTEPPQP